MNREAGAGGAPGMRRALAALLVLGIVGGVALTEVIYRVMRRFVCVGAPSAPVWRIDPRYGWGHRPNGSGWMYYCLGRRFEWREYTTINSKGLVDRERAYERAPGVRRVLLLGDSMTEAMQVPIERRFASLIETNLGGRGTPVEVINGGVAAFGTDNELLFFRNEGVKYRPDVVLLVFNAANDVSDNSQALSTRLYAANPEKLLPKTYFHLDARGEAEPGPQPPPYDLATPKHVPLWSQIENRVYLLRALRRLAPRTVPASGPPASASPPMTALPAGLTVFDVMRVPPDQEWSEAWRVTEGLVRALRREVEEAGARLAVAVVPAREAVSPAAWQSMLRLLPALTATPHDPTYPVIRITGFLEREGIPYVSLLPALRAEAERTGKSGYFSWDVHFDADGHAVVAASLAPFVGALLQAD